MLCRAVGRYYSRSRSALNRTRRMKTVERERRAEAQNLFGAGLYTMQRDDIFNMLKNRQLS